MRRLLLKSVIVSVFIIAGIASRTFLHIAPNVELVTTLSLLAGYYFGGWVGLLVPFGIMAGSDFFLGNTSIFLFTWSAYLIGGLLGYLLRHRWLRKRVVLASLGAGIVFSLFFYLYTNFGVWLITPWYERSLSGLLYCYYMGLPFLKYNLGGNIFFVPLGFLVSELIRCRLASRRYDSHPAPISSKQ